MNGIAKYGIPTQALAIVATTLACESTDPMIGDFECTFFALDGVRTDCPYTYTYTFEGTDYETVGSLFLTVTEAGTGTFSGLYTTYTLPNRDFYSEEGFDHALQAVQVDEGVWDIAIPEHYGLQMQCDADFTGATCYGTDADGRAWEFNWASIGGGGDLL